MLNLGRRGKLEPNKPIGVYSYDELRKIQLLRTFRISAESGEEVGF